MSVDITILKVAFWCLDRLPLCIMFHLTNLYSKIKTYRTVIAIYETVGNSIFLLVIESDLALFGLNKVCELWKFDSRLKGYVNCSTLYWDVQSLIEISGQIQDFLKPGKVQVNFFNWMVISQT